MAAKGHYFIVVIENISEAKIVAMGTLLIELKLIHGASKVELCLFRTYVSIHRRGISRILWCRKRVVDWILGKGERVCIPHVSRLKFSNPEL